jgi:hypothetical protein
MVEKQEQSAKDNTEKIITLLTTEQFVLQSARSGLISDGNGRASLFLSSVSSGIVALAFVGQANC